MPDPVGTVFVEVRPDLTAFQAELQTALSRAVRGITPPTAGLGRGAAAQTAFGTATKRTTRALSEQAAVMQLNSTELARFSRGVAATTLATFGLRGATLASTSAFLAGAAAITTLSKALGVATTFNSQLAVFQATTGATAAELERVSDTAKALGASLQFPGVSATDAAIAMTELAKAGLSVNDAIAGAAGVLQLAGAANIDFAQAVELAASALNAFQLAGSQASVVADVLANAANAAQGSIVDVGIAFQQAAAVGHQVGLSFQDVTLFITELARAGLTGSDAGTSLRTALIRLINPTDKAKKIFKELGLEVRDAQGNLRPEFFTNLGEAIAGMTAKQRDATLAQIGGQDAIRALAILSRTSTKDLIALRKELDAQGTAAKVNAARNIGLKGASENLKNTIETFALTLGQKATPSLIGVTHALTDFIKEVAKSPAIGVLGSFIEAVAGAVRDLATAFRTVAPVIEGVISAFSKVANVIGPTAILAGVAAYLALGKAISTVIPAVTALTARLIAARTAQLAYAAAAAGAGVETVGLGAALAGMVNPTTALVVLTAAATAGLVFLITREREATQTAKALKAATADLAAAMREQAGATQALGDAQSALKTDQIAVQTARLGVEQAKNDLANLKAERSSLAYKQAVNRLEVAQDTLRRALQQVATDKKAVKQATDDLAKSDQKYIDVAKEEVELLDRSVRVIKTSADLRKTGATFALTAAEAEKVAKDRITERIKELEKLPGAENAALAARLKAIRELVGKTKDFDLTARLVLQAPDLDTGLARVQSLLERTGQESGARFVEGLRLQMNPGSIGKVMGDLPGVFAEIGKNSGVKFAQGLVNAVQNAIALVNRLILSGARQLTTQLSNQVDTLLAGVQRVELFGGTLAQQLAAAKEARDRAKRELAAADAAVKATGGRSQADKERQAKALQDFATAQGNVDRIEGEIAAKQKAAADARDKKIQEAQKARDKADQDFLTLMGQKRAGVDLAAAKAGLTESLVDDIAVQRLLQTFLLQEIAEANTTIKDVNLRIQTVNQLTLELVQSQVATRNLLKQQEENRKQRIRDKRDRQQEGLELDVQIAETQKNRAKELKAHERLRDFLIARRRHTTAGTVEYKRLTLAIAQEDAAIAELRKKNKDQRNALKSLEFEFLQTQSGFVANLLGNLLPIGALGGVVGGAAGAPGGTATTTAVTPTVPAAGFATAVHQRGPTAPLPANFATAAHRRGRVRDGVATAVQAGAAAGASFGQMSTLIQIARQQLAVLQSVTGKRSHPEANVQRAAQHAAMDTLPF